MAAAVSIVGSGEGVWGEGIGKELDKGEVGEIGAVSGVGELEAVFGVRLGIVSGMVGLVLAVSSLNVAMSNGVVEVASRVVEDEVGSNVG